MSLSRAPIDSTRGGRAPLVAVLALVSSSLFVARAAEGDEGKGATTVETPRARLEAVLAEVAARRADLTTLESTERSLTETIGGIDRALYELDRARDEARIRHTELVAEVRELDLALVEDTARERETARRLERRLRALYVLGDEGAIRHLLGAESFEELAYRRRLLSTLAENDARLAREHARVAASVREKRDALARAEAELALLAAKLDEERALGEAAKRERQAAMARIEGERELMARALRELLVEEKRLRGEIDAIVRASTPRRASQGARALLKKGGLLRPVDGPVSRAFGTVREAGTGASLTSNGIHVKAPKGTPVVAPADGRVVHAGWLRGYGRMLILDHGDGVHTLYAHLEREVVEKGAEVTRGDVIGFVGDSESFDGAELYFELRRNGRPRDPVPSF